MLPFEEEREKEKYGFHNLPNTQIEVSPSRKNRDIAHWRCVVAVPPIYPKPQTTPFTKSIGKHVNY